MAEAQNFPVPPNISVLDTEYTDDLIGMKLVFSGTRDDGKVATFETGSFFDQYGTPENPDRHDICVSTAGGCTRHCNFCSVPDAELGFERLLTPEEIVFQVLYSIAQRNPDGVMPNVVGLMGNGEPPDNIAVIPAVERLALDTDANISRITFSTIGENVRNIGKMANAFAELDMQTILQFSLHSADEAKRRSIIPGRMPLAKVLEAVDGYAETTGEPAKFNVVLMEGSGQFQGFTNADSEDAKRLAELLLSPSYTSGSEIKRLLKLSAFNTVPGKEFRGPSQEKIQAFVDVLGQEGISEIQLFKGSGVDIDVDGKTGGFACGQLRATTANTATRTEVTLTKKPRKTIAQETGESDLDAEWRANRGLFVVGIHAVGKSTIVEKALESGYAVFDAGPILEEEFEKDTEKPTFEEWIAKSEATYGSDFVARLLARHINGKLANNETEHPAGVVVIGSRKVKVLEHLQRELNLSDSRVLLVKAPEEVLFERYKKREEEEGKIVSRELFLNKLAYDRSLGVAALEACADWTVFNDSDIDASIATVRRLMEEWQR